MVDVENSDPMPAATGTTFSNTEGSIPISVMDRHVFLNSNITDSADTGYEQGVIHFLQKPYPLFNGNITTATTGQVATFNLFSDVLNQTIYTNKLQGFMAFKATAVIRLQVNANRFQQGRLLLHFLPQAQVTGMDVDKMRNVNLTLKTQHPRVELDIGTQSECIMEIPYTSPYNFLSLQNGTGNLGTVYLDIFSALQVGAAGTNNFDYTIWVSFKDIEINTPSTGTLTFGTQMDDSVESSSKKSQKGGHKKVQDAGRDLGQRIVSMMPNGSLKQKLVKQKEEKSTSWLSSTLGDLGSIASTIAVATASSVPMLSAIATPVSWVCSAASGLASAFGWSKRTITNEATIVKFGSPPYMANSDGCDTSVVLANQATNEIRVLPGFAGNDIDEMSISYLCQKPAYYTSFTWDVASARDTELQQLPMQPLFYYNRGSVTNATRTCVVDYHTPISFFSRFFRYYRGSIRITLKFVKTEFHSGRLLLIYSPGGGFASSNADSTYLFRDIIDLRHSNEYSFVAPYASVQPWRPTFNIFGSSTTSAYGNVSIRVLNELVAPGNVPTNINCLIEISAAEDFQLAGPGTPGAGTNSATLDKFLIPFRAQMDTSSEIIGEVSKPIGNSKMLNPGNLAPAEFCMGEAVLSIKQLLTRMCPLKATFALNAFGPITDVNPFFIGTYGQPSSGTGPGGYSGIYGDYYSILSSCFAYSRGSVRWGYAKWATSNSRLQTKAYFCSDPTKSNEILSAYQAGGTEDIMSLIAYHNLNQCNNFVEVKVPGYNGVPTRLNKFNYGGSVATTASYDAYVPKVRLAFNTSEVVDVPTLYRAVGDDFQLGYFIGCPPCFVSDT